MRRGRRGSSSKGKDESRGLFGHGDSHGMMIIAEHKPSFKERVAEAARTAAREVVEHHPTVTKLRDRVERQISRAARSATRGMGRRRLR